jgi:molybdopterin molybdotransferase
MSLALQSEAMAVSEQTPVGGGAGLLEIEDARRLIIAAAGPLGGEPVELVSGLGRVLAEDAHAPEPVPAFDGSAMDGYALRAADLLGAGEDRPATLEVVGESRAGKPAEVALAPGQAIAISTGAVIPQGADAVVRVEDTRPAASGEGRVEILIEAPVGLDVRYAGEDIQAGERVLRRGTPLGPAELGVLASLGRASALCVRRPRLSLLVSGDELIPLGGPSRVGGVRDSNSLTLSALARRAGGEVVRVATVGDDPEATREALAIALAGVELAVICGGVSVGVHDHIRPALSELGAEEHFWGVALKPGRPTWFGTLGKTLVFGLPGNPVSAMVTFLLLVQPALRAMLGLPPEMSGLSAVMEEDYAKPPGRAQAVRCSLSTHQDGWHARPTGAQGSHILTSMLGADGLVLIPTASEGVKAGERVEVEPLRMWVETLS